MYGKRILSGFLLAFLVIGVNAQPLSGNSCKATADNGTEQKTSQWSGKRVAYLGDSMTQKRDTSLHLYWEYLAEMLDITPFVYGISGNQWDGIYKQAQKLLQEHGTDVDAIFIFAGTNDYNHGIPMGKFYEESTRETIHNGKNVVRKYRTLVENDSTFCGRINKVMAFLKTNFPEQQVIVMTPIHRGYAKFNATNEQPEERYANAQGLYLDDYVETLKKAASIWSVPLIDLHSLSGLYPLAEAHARYFKNAQTDLLHPSKAGHLRLASTIKYQLLALPATFTGEL
jgi:lysophospholipase L1-like esterase